MNNGEKKENEGFGRGIILIIIGVAALLATFFEFDIDWNVVGHMWPVILIAIGVGIMPINRWIRFLLVCALLAIGYVAYQHKLGDDTTTVIHKTEIISRYHDDDSE